MSQSNDDPGMKVMTGEWRYLAMFNYRIDPQVLAPYVPAGAALDTWHGECLISVVGLRFLSLAALGVPVPLHRNFPQVNLRFYVRTERDGEVRHGARFLQEFVPLPTMAYTAKLVMNEPLTALPMQSTAPTEGGAVPGRVAYAWQSGTRWNHIAVRPTGSLLPVADDSLEQFVIERFWGYTPQRDGGTLEYGVRHPRWRVWRVAEPEFEVDVAHLYGPEFVEALSAPPRSVFLAEGSPVAIFMPHRIA